ncbi:MAG: hypothetical protein KBF76_18445 [Verrucomicrobiales bacterium]|nr:hypothetical protein [Verrucomicrobiales bacterium]HQZ27504.1 plastocyanin/azurin family copper-binding protein [Verrucomicrobiales bacterium]
MSISSMKSRSRPFFAMPFLPKIVTLVRILLLGAAIGITLPSIGTCDDVTDVAEITITAHKSELHFDKKEFTVKAGQKVKLTLVNPDDSLNLQPHNLLIIEPGTLEEVGAAAEAELSDPTFLSDRQAIPTSNYVLYHTKLLQPGESETIEFTAPTFATDYPFLCSYPGHWRVMNGIMIVEN